MMTPEELERYQRQVAIPDLGETGQEKLKQAGVVLVGVGGLGSPVAIYLVAAGIGRLRIIDAECVELSNLNRQILHWTRDIGRLKIESARRKLKALNPQVKIEIVHKRISEVNVDRLVEGGDVVVDAVDNLETRYILNRAAVRQGIPLIHGAVGGFEGRAMTVIPGKSACLMCLYRGIEIKVNKTPVIGVAPALIASVQATEVIKCLTGIGDLLAGRLLVYDGRQMRFEEVKVARDPHCPVCGER